jgi:predicted Zn finger-like uncharacterized protein
MKFGIDCPSCRASFQVAEENAGKRGRCPRCNEIFHVPDPPSTVSRSAKPSTRPDEEDESGAYELEGAPKAGIAARMTAARAATSATKRVEAAPTRPTRTPVQILAAFRGEIEPVQPTAMYRLWIVIIAFFMILLPAIYLSLVAIVGYGVYLHAITNHVLLTAGGGGRHSAKVALILYVGPMVVGLIVVAFMLKPLFARAGKKQKSREIDPSKEALLAAFVDGVCSSVGAPTPSGIEVDCQVNASAHLASWVLSPSKELVLTIGLPLVAGLTLRQFTGVLAHEFGHFSQGTGMRLTVLIRSINRWFARVVYERDEWDETLASWTHGEHIAVIIVAFLAKLSVWLTRRVLWVLMYVGHMVSGFLTRQMEFDADRYEARMVGSDVFAQTSERLRELGLAWGAAHNELTSSWRERRLPDDLPRLVLVEASKIPDPVRTALKEATENARTGLFDTHPCDRERIARALDEDTDGIFHLDGPATDLFRDFDGLSRVTTFDYYRSMLGRDVTRDQLYPVTEALLNQEVQREGSEAFNRFFLGALGPIQAVPLPPSYPPAPADPKAAKREIVAARLAMLEALEENRELVKTWGVLHGKRVQAEAASILLKVGKSIKAADFGLSKAKLPVAEATLDEVGREIEAVNADFERFAEAAAKRLTTALGLLEIDAVAARVPDGLVRREETRALYACAMTLASRIMPEMAKLNKAMQASGIVVTIYQSGKNSQDEAMINALLRSARLIHESLTELKWKIGEAIPYPFEHAQERITLGRYALATVPDPQAVGDLFQAGGETQDRIFPLHNRVLGRLTATAEAVEKAIGLQPLKAPERVPSEFEEQA